MSDTKPAREDAPDLGAQGDADANAPSLGEPAAADTGTPPTDVASPANPEARTDDPAPNEESAALRKRKKRKKRISAEGEPRDSNERPELDPQGNERPRFLLRFPRDPELEPLIAAFEVGDFARVREEASRVAERATEPEVKRAALELLRRTEPDPLMKFVFLAAVGLFVAVVTYVYYAHG